MGCSEQMQDIPGFPFKPIQIEIQIENLFGFLQNFDQINVALVSKSTNTSWPINSKTRHCQSNFKTRNYSFPLNN